MKSLLVAFFLLFAISINAATYYVSPSGTNTTCTNASNVNTPAGPKLQFVMGCMVGGDTLIARGGNYEEPLHKPGFNGFFPSGTVATPTVFKTYPGEKPVMKSTPSPWGSVFELSDNVSYITFDGINFDGYVAPEYRGFAHEYVPIKIGMGSHHIRITNGEVKNLPDGWFSSNTGNDNEVSNMVIYDGFPASAYLSGGTGCGQAVCWGYPFYWNGLRNKILRNHMYNFQSWGVHLYCSGPGYCNYPTETLVQDNNIHDYGYGDPSRANGILVSQGNANQVITNAVWNKKATALEIGIGTAATNTIVQGNTFVAPPTTQPPPVTPPVPAPVTNWVDIRTDKTVTITGNSITIPKDKNTNIIVNGSKR